MRVLLSLFVLMARLSVTFTEHLKNGATMLRQQKADRLVALGRMSEEPLARTEIFHKALELEPLHVSALVALGMAEFEDPPNEEIGVDRFVLAFESDAYPRPVDVDSELGYGLAARIGVFRANRKETNLAKPWLERAVRSRFPHDDCWDVFKSGVLPTLPTREEEIEAAATYHANMDRLLAKAGRGELAISLTSCIQSAFWLAYFDLDVKAAVSKYVDLHAKAFPSLLWISPHLLLAAPPPPPEQLPSSRTGRIRVGFVSSFFYSPESSVFGSFWHTIMRLPRESFDISLIYYPRAPIGKVEKSLSPTPENDVYLPQLGPRLENIVEAREAIAAKQLDILVYLDLYMTSEMHQLAMSRLARVQACTHGHPVTSGIPRSVMNYYISWAAAELPDAQDHYTEELVLIPEDVVWEYWEPRNTLDQRTIVGGMVAWGHYNRTNLDFLTRSASIARNNWYFCAQPSFKYHASFYPILAKILKSDQNGVLILIKLTGEEHSGLHPALVRNLKIAGVNMKRVVFVPRLLHYRLMAMYKLSDVILDSIYFGGDTTSREAFEVGAPVVTLPHKLLGTRWTQAYYKSMGVLDLIAKDADSYVRLAVGVGTDKVVAAELRQRILANNHKLYRSPEAAKAWTKALMHIAPPDAGAIKDNDIGNVKPQEPPWPGSGGKKEAKSALSSSVRLLNKTSVAMLLAAPPTTPVFVMVEPHDECRSCEAMGAFWETAAMFMPWTLWRVKCSPDSELCAHLGLLTSNLPFSHEPEFASWSSRGVRFYRGARNPDSLLQFVYAEAKFMEPARGVATGVPQKVNLERQNEVPQTTTTNKSKQDELQPQQQFSLEDRGHGYRKCSTVGVPAAVGTAAARREGASGEQEGLSLVVLDGTYMHPVSGAPMLTPQLRLSYASWAKSGLFARTRERILFIQGIRVEHCGLVSDLTFGTDHGNFLVVGNIVNVGIPNGQAYLFRMASSSHLLFLERDFVAINDRKNLDAHLNFAEGILQRSPDPKGVVLLRGCCGHRDGGAGKESSTSVCEGDDIVSRLQKASEPDLVWTTQHSRTFSFDKCETDSVWRWAPPGYFFTTITAFEHCRGRAFVEQLRLVNTLPDAERRAFLQDSMVNQCNDAHPIVYCHRSLTAHWTNHPWLALRSFVLKDILPHYPDCQQVHASERAFCNYLGVESNSRLQCHLRSLNYTVWQTEGVFRHQRVDRSSEMASCYLGNGYVEGNGGAQNDEMQCVIHR